MVKYLLYIGLIVLPFLVVKGYDTRYPKELLSIGISLVIALSVLYQGRMKPFRNYWALGFVAWCYVATVFAPKINGLYLSGGGNMDGLWNFKPLFMMSVYLLALIAISSQVYSAKTLNIIFKIIANCGFFMACYVILQFFGIDPVFSVKEAPEIKVAVTSPSLVGTLGQPTIAGAFLVLTVPFILLLRKYLYLAVICAALLAIKSDLSIVALFASVIFYFFNGKSWHLAIAGMILGILGFILLKVGIFSDSGRFFMWQSIFDDVKRVFFTGFGVGAFSYLFSVIHNHPSSWLQAHNEYLEVLWGAGIIGLFIMIKAIFWYFKKSFKHLDNENIRCLTCALFTLCLCAGANFIWHLGVFCFYTVVILGLLNSKFNEEYKKGDICIS